MSRHAADKLLRTGLTRRRFLQGAAASGVVAGTWVTPNIVSVGIKPAFAIATPIPSPTPNVGETLIVPWNASGGVSTTNSYSGHVKLAISGFVSATPPQLSDAFYRIIDVGGTTLATPVSECDGAGGSEFLSYSLSGDTRRLEGSGVGLHTATVWVQGVGSVTPPFCPPFDSSGDYCVVLDLGAFSGAFHLGSGDGGVGDNSGFLTIVLTQL